MKRAVSILLGLIITFTFLHGTSHAQTDDTVYSLADEQPAFPGGMSAFFKYIQTDMQYPESALAKKTEGRVFVEYIVEKDGSISNPKILKGLSPDCDKEAIRLISSSVKWTPGKKGGKAVRVKMALPLNFKLPK